MNLNESQRIANEIDRSLFRVLSRCEEMVERDPARQREWRRILWILRDARPPLRELMNMKDREATS